MLTRTPSKSTSDQRRAHTSPRRGPFKLGLNEFVCKHVFPVVERKLGRALNGAEASGLHQAANVLRRALPARPHT